MAQQLITFGSDRRLVLANGEAIRSPAYTSNWTKIRIGLRCAFVNVGANITGTPKFAIGVCHGSTNPFGAAESDNVVGIMPTASTWSYNASPAYIQFGSGSTNIKPFTRVGSTLTPGTASSDNIYISVAPDTIRSGLFLDITKGEPDYTLRWGSERFNSVNTDLSDTMFDDIMDLTDISAISTIKTNAHAPNAVTIAASESAGAFDHIFIYWERTSQQFSFDIKHRKLA